METFGTIESSNHTIDKYGAYANLEWQIVSASDGTRITLPENISELSGSIVLSRATKQVGNIVNIDTGVFEHILYRSINQIFYNRPQFVISGSVVTSTRLYEVPDDVFVLSLGQNLYGEQITPGTFVASIHPSSASISDDGVGTLYVRDGNQSYVVGDIFYSQGIAVFTHNVAANTTSITADGVKIVSGSALNLSYDSSMTFEQHEITVALQPQEFTFSPFNPTVLRPQDITGAATQSFLDEGIVPTNDNQWQTYNLMRAGIIKPYVTTIGLYNDQYQLLAVAKLSTPIQRTFTTNQIFIIRFDTE